MIVELSNKSYQIISSTSVEQNITLGQAIDLILEDWAKNSQEANLIPNDQEDKLSAITAKLEQVDQMILEVLEKCKNCRL